MSPSTKKLKTFNLNFGPQHPAAHGVLRLVLQLNGEIIENSDVHIGLLHRGSEKLIENKNYIQALPYFDRFDYLSTLAQEHAYCLTVENLLNINNFTASHTLVRTIFDEFSRILNHLLAISCHALDVGSMSSPLWAFEEREKILEFVERISGARMHAAFYRPGEQDFGGLSSTLLIDMLSFMKQCAVTIDNMHILLTYNKIWKQRLVNIGQLPFDKCTQLGLTGVLARGSGIKKDLRIEPGESYANYPSLFFRTYYGINGDCYDRYLIRMYEIIESMIIINQCIKKTQFKIYYTPMNQPRLLQPLKFIKYLSKNKYDIKIKKNSYNNMEQLIHHYRFWAQWKSIEPNFTYSAIESPKGEFGVTLLSDGSNMPQRCKVRSPAYHNLHALKFLMTGHSLADLAALVGTVDIVFGEIDR